MGYEKLYGTAIESKRPRTRGVSRTCRSTLWKEYASDHLTRRRTGSRLDELLLTTVCKSSVLGFYTYNLVRKVVSFAKKTGDETPATEQLFLRRCCRLKKLFLSCCWSTSALALSGSPHTRILCTVVPLAEFPPCSSRPKSSVESGSYPLSLLTTRLPRSRTRTLLTYPVHVRTTPMCEAA